jgi:hypothetical protein
MGSAALTVPEVSARKATLQCAVVGQPIINSLSMPSVQGERGRVGHLDLC